jgi:hypothetical protein
MLTITFDPSFDQGFWPGPLADKIATAGEVWVGPMGLLNILETMTGLRGPGVPPALRAASLVPALRSTNGFWSASAEVDPLGTASKLLQWRDYLKIYGWQGQKCSPRLGELAQVTQEVLPGIPDRLLAITQHLSPAGNDISHLIVFHPLDELPLCWQQVLHTLEQTGTTVTAKDISPVRAGGDLAAARQDEFQPKADGSLQLLRPSNPSAAAQEVAAWLSGLDCLDQTVIIGPDSILDQALHRFGLPTSGAGITVYDNALLQILPLTLEMAWLRWENRNAWWARPNTLSGGPFTGKQLSQYSWILLPEGKKRPWPKLGSFCLIRAARRSRTPAVGSGPFCWLKTPSFWSALNTARQAKNAHPIPCGMSWWAGWPREVLLPAWNRAMFCPQASRSSRYESYILCLAPNPSGGLKILKYLQRAGGNRPTACPACFPVHFNG